jgi:magnesium transporter
MVTAVARVRPGESVGECRTRVREHGGAGAGALAVIGDGELLGLVAAGELLAAADEVLVGALASGPVEPVGVETPIEAAAGQLVSEGQPAVAVCDRDGRFAGLIPATRMAAVLLVEHDEDLARLGGYRSSARRARSAAEEPLVRRLWHRLPWLIVGLAGAMISVLLVGAFEEQLEQVVLLSFFVPAVVYMSGSVATQTQTLLIRALAAELDLRTVIRRELLTGIWLGLIVGALFYPFAFLIWDDGDVALTVALAMFASCSIATTVAMALPFGLRRLGFDPAFGSGPLATVIQDLLSILIYFAIAVPLAT